MVNNRFALFLNFNISYGNIMIPVISSILFLAYFAYIIMNAIIIITIININRGVSSPAADPGCLNTTRTSRYVRKVAECQYVYECI